MRSFALLSVNLARFIGAKRTIEFVINKAQSTEQRAVLPSNICPSSIAFSDAFTLVEAIQKSERRDYELRIGLSVGGSPDRVKRRVIQVWKNPGSGEDTSLAIWRLGLPFFMDVEAVFYPEHSELYVVHPIYTEDFFHFQNRLWPYYSSQAFFKVKWTLADIGRYASQAAYGLWMLHRRNFLQRDLSLNSFALSSDKQKLMFMNHFSAIKCEGQACAEGTEWMHDNPWLMSLPMAEGAKYGFETDWWMFGHFIFQLAAGFGADPAYGKFDTSNQASKEAFLKRLSEGTIWWPQDMDEGIKLFLKMLLGKSSFTKWVSAAGELAGSDPSRHPVLSDPFWLQFAAKKEELQEESLASEGIQPLFQTYEENIRQYWNDMCMQYAPDPFGESCFQDTKLLEEKSLCPPEVRCNFGDGSWKVTMSLNTKDGKEEWHKTRVMRIQHMEPPKDRSHQSCRFVLQMAKTGPSNTKSEKLRLDCPPAPTNTFHGMFKSRVIYECTPVDYKYKHNTRSAWKKIEEWNRKVRIRFLEDSLIVVNEEGEGDGGEFEAVFERI